ncbi:anthranilate synthase [Candidatus Riesia sp. GBBU]|nr:anthranilate synthase [Candidatus Riesia sp. GBBU]
MILIIDNYDSFTYNLYQYFCELGKKVIVKRNDKISLKEIGYISPSHIVISPGPGSPNSTGISSNVVSFFSKKIPILGICIGHQVIGQVFGASVIKAKIPFHGKASLIYHKDVGIMKNVSSPIKGARYHSLIIDAKSIPSVLEVTCWTIKKGKFDEIMGIRHKKLPIEGLQFHPESILTESGHKLLKNFLEY